MTTPEFLMTYFAPMAATFALGLAYAAWHRAGIRIGRLEEELDDTRQTLDLTRWAREAGFRQAGGRTRDCTPSEN